MSSEGYIYIPNWDGPKGFQHYGDRRPSWIKNYVDLLDNDAYLDLSLADRGVLHAIWMLVARVGQGRCIYSASYLQKQCNAPAGHMRRSLERLNHAGFIEVRASRALAVRYQKDTLEVEEREGLQPSLSQKENARASRAAQTAARARPEPPPRRSFAALGPPTKNGDQPSAADIGRRRRVVKNNYDGVLLENGPEAAKEWLQENHPDLVTQIIARKPATKEPSA